ncbi:PfkB family carbohydrate kinase [Kutzneria kofuensis]|uniref:Sugar/nucleoside kinase (Ribokinase family) n=1 Tax=Kutzneria kofuensis TaxID=103725 RepID=A0A7W9KQK2_9PSEU|nr:PfkB family carbohydrate kinase [Kutzneria kofuensis]MBB5896894.1 sugar/nucleoside kinase (ribokinase family) [Kutzneria kofuensis]
MATPAAVPDVFLSGLLFYDIGFACLPAAPAAGTEVWARERGTSPGGIANFAVALSRLGLRTALAAAIGDDVTGDMCRRELTAEGIDLSLSRRLPDWPMPLTVAMAYDGDRALITHGSAPPVTADDLIGTPPTARAAVAHLCPEPQAWIGKAAAQGTLLFADAGWAEASHHREAILAQLPDCHAFLPNDREAMAYTRTDSPTAALAALAELVPLAVVTCGADGALGIDATTGETATVPGIAVDAVDTTGAGDVFGAALVFATLAGLPLADRLRFAALVAALSVRRIGGAASAPHWSDVDSWRRDNPRPDYVFLDDLQARVGASPWNSPADDSSRHPR